MPVEPKRRRAGSGTGNQTLCFGLARLLTGVSVFLLHIGYRLTEKELDKVGRVSEAAQ